MKHNTARKVNPTLGNGKGNLEPGRQLYQMVRGALIARGAHLKGWCRENGVNETTARAALYGFTNSAEAAVLRARLLRAAGLEGEWP